MSVSSCNTISNSSCIGGKSLSDRPLKKEYRLRVRIVSTVILSWDKTALCRIQGLVAASEITVIASLSRYQNWFLATLLE